MRKNSLSVEKFISFPQGKSFIKLVRKTFTFCSLLDFTVATATSCTYNPHERQGILYVCRINAHGYKKQVAEEAKNDSPYQIRAEEAKNCSLCQIRSEEAKKVSLCQTRASNVAYIKFQHNSFVCNNFYLYVFTK